MLHALLALVVATPAALCSQAHAHVPDAVGDRVAPLAIDLPGLRATARREQVRLESLALGGSEPVTLLLDERRGVRPFVVLSTPGPDGAILDAPAAPPSITILHGGVEGEPGSLAVLGVRDDGVQGFVRRASGTWIITSGRFGAGLPAVSYPLDDVMSAALGAGVPTCEAESLAGYAEGVAALAPAPQGGAAGTPPCRAVEVALETDLEFTTSLFEGDTAAAADYAFFLLSAVSEIYRDALNARLDVVFLRLWSSSDIWDGGTTSAQLGQFKKIWNLAMTLQPRDLSHFLSGRPLGGGIAYLSAICSPDGGYAVSANLNGTFPYPIADHQSQNWDLMVVAHELGHNFGSPHTHSYSPPLDGCGIGDCSQAWGGTIMSYCHTCPGGISNMVMAFHPENIVTMNAFLDSIACPAQGEPGSVQDDLADAAEGIPVLLDVLGNDFDSDCTEPAIDGHEMVSVAGGAVSIVAGAGANGRDAVEYAPPPGFSGLDSFAYSASVDGGASQWATVAVQVHPLQPGVQASGLPAGVAVSYYDLDNPSQLPDFDQLDAFAGEIVDEIDVPSTNGTFAGSGLADDVGAVYEGFLYAATPGLYALSVESDDGSRLLIGGALVVDNDGLHGMLEKSGLVALAKGWHPLRVEFFERGGGAGVIARMKGPDIPRQVMPHYWLAHGVPGDLDGNGIVNGADLGALLAAWGSGGANAADLNGDGVVDGSDLGILLASWSGG